jgi:hypothetical protein
MTVRMVKMGSLDGEYQILSRMTPEVNNALVPFGTSGNSVVQIPGSGINEAEFTDGFRMSIRATQPITVNVSPKNGIATTMLTAMPGAQSLSKYKAAVSKITTDRDERQLPLSCYHQLGRCSAYA